MTFNVWVSGVDGETNVSMQTPDPAHALKFLQQHDHEGSCVGVTIRANDEQTYRVLEVFVKELPS